MERLLQDNRFSSPNKLNQNGDSLLRSLLCQLHNRLPLLKLHRLLNPHNSSNHDGVNLLRSLLNLSLFSSNLLHQQFQCKLRLLNNKHDGGNPLRNLYSPPNQYSRLLISLFLSRNLNNKDLNGHGQTNSQSNLHLLNHRHRTKPSNQRPINNQVHNSSKKSLPRPSRNRNHQLPSSGPLPLG